MMRQPPADHLGDPVGQASAWNIANALTVIRLLLVPVFVVVAVSGFEDDNTSAPTCRHWGLLGRSAD